MIGAEPAPTQANPMSAGAAERVPSASTMPKQVRMPLRSAKPSNPQRSSSESPTSRARPIASEKATTPPAASAALVPTGPVRKTAAQLIVDASTKKPQNMSSAGSASGPRGRAKCAESSAAPRAGSSEGVAMASTHAAAAATTANCTRMPTPAAAAPTAIPEPASRPKLHAL